MPTVSVTQIDPSDEITSAGANLPHNELAAAINGNLDSDNIADAAITTAKIVDGSVTTAKVNDLAITNAKINDVSAAKFTNPYKFSVYRSAALSSASSYTKVDYDTTTFDTGSNVTNNDRFVAPVAGFYYFAAAAGNTAAGGTAQYVALYKNGSRVKLGNGNAATTTGQMCVVSGLLQLAATDYVEVYFVGGSGSTMNVGADVCYFDGFLVSAT